MAGAYSAFASMGYYVEPYSVKKIEFRDTGEVKEYDVTKERVMADSTAYLMNNVLEYATNYGFDGGAKVAGSHVATKTGTSNFDDATLAARKLPPYAVNDLWTVSYTSKYSIALWYGYEDNSSGFYNTNNSPKGRVMSAVMSYIPKDTTGWTMPSSVVPASVEMGTWPAKLASQYTPSDLVRTEYFKKGTQPTELSDRFSQLNDVTNLKSTTNNNSVSLSWKYTTPEILDRNYLSEYFNQAVFGNSSGALLNARITYNSNVLGNIGFGIYLKNSNGELSRIGFTTDNSYTYNSSSLQNGTATFIVKAEYSNFKSNASNGIETKTTISNSGSPSTPNLSINFGDTNTTYNVGAFKNPAMKITYDSKDVTSDANVVFTIQNVNTANSSTELENIMNSLTAGDYTIKYTVTYKDSSITKEKKITLK